MGRAVRVLETSMFGLAEMEEKMTIATVMGMLHPCGPFPSILPSTPAKMPTTTNPAPQHSHRPSPMALKIPTLALQPLTYTANVQEHIPEPQLQHQKPLGYLHLHLMRTESLPGETCNISPS